MEVYKQNMAWRQGKIGAERDAVEAYRLMAGDHRQDAGHGELRWFLRQKQLRLLVT